MDRIDLIIQIDKISREIKQIKEDRDKIYLLLDSNKKKLKELIKQSNYLISKVNNNSYVRMYITDSDDDLFYNSD